MSLDDAVLREQAWFQAEPPASFPTAPPLIAAHGGPFDVVQGLMRAITQRERALYILRERVIERRIAMGGIKELEHHMVVVVYWSITNAHIETDQTKHDQAVASVVTRIRGPQGDKTHGGAFFAVGEDGSDIRVEPQNLIPSLLNGGPLETHIRYVALDTFPA